MTDPVSPLVGRSLLVFAVLYGGMTCIAGVLGNKLVALGPFAVEGGIFAFLLLIVLGSATAELHGEATAKRLILLGFVPLLASMLLIRLVLALPPASFWEAGRREAFTLVLGQSVRLMFAGCVAYGVSQLLNVTVFTRLRTSARGYVWLHSLIAGVLSQVADTLLFITIAFYGNAPLAKILPGQLIAKVILSAVVVPLLTTLTVAVGRNLDRSEGSPPGDGQNV